MKLRRRIFLSLVSLAFTPLLTAKNQGVSCRSSIGSKRYNNPNQFRVSSIKGDPYGSDDDFEATSFTFAPTVSVQTAGMSLFVSESPKSAEIIQLIRKSTALFPSLMATALSSLGIFVSWQIPRFRHTLQSWTVASRYNLDQGRWPSLVLSAISHSSVTHIFFNLLTLLSFGPSVQRSLQSTSLQPWPIWPLLLGSSISGSGMYLTWQAVVAAVARSLNHRVYSTRSGCMGLSAVTCALVAVHSRMNPDARLQMLVAGVIPVHMSAHILLSVLFAFSVVAMLVTSNREGGTAHSAHVGGLLFGLMYHEIWTRRYRLAWRIHQAKRRFLSN